MPQQRILLGVIGRPHGVRGLVRVTSHTADPAALTAYGPLSDDKGRRFVLRWRGAGVAEVEAQVGGTAVKVADRTAAEKLTNTRLYIERAQLPEPEPDEFYLADLLGLTAVDAGGRVLGTVGTVHDYGAGSSLEIVQDGAPPLLVPFTRAAVPEVDLPGGRVTVDVPAPVHLAHEGDLGREADQGGRVAQRTNRSDEGEGDRVGAPHAGGAGRPDHPHPRRSHASPQSASRLDLPAGGRGVLR